jgi:hypothetical protein
MLSVKGIQNYALYSAMSLAVYSIQFIQKVNGVESNKQYYSLLQFSVNQELFMKKHTYEQEALITSINILSLMQTPELSFNKEIDNMLKILYDKWGTLFMDQIECFPGMPTLGLKAGLAGWGTSLLGNIRQEPMMPIDLILLSNKD